MSDRDLIIDLTHDYGWALDTKQFEQLRSVFLDDATATLHGVECAGVDAIIARIGGAVSRFDVTQHLVGNHQVTVDGDTASCRCQLQAQHVRRGTDGGDNYVIGGYYIDELTRTDGGWRISHRLMQETWTDGNPEVAAR